MKTSKEKLAAFALVFLTGYLGLALELLVLRQAASFVGGTASVTSVVIGIFLGAMTAGYFVGSGRLGRNADKRIGIGFLAIAALIVLSCSYPLVAVYFNAMMAAGLTSPIAQTFVYSVLFLSVTPFLFGFNTAALSQSLHEPEHSTAGLIMGIGTIGSVLGSLLTTLAFMALMGVNNTIILTTALACIGAYAAYRRPWVAGTAILIFAAAWLMNDSGMLKRDFGIVSNNAINSVAVQEADGGRYLLISQAVHSAVSNDGQLHTRYVDYINWRFIDTIPKDQTKNILALGAGGFTIGDLDTRNNYTFVDIDAALKDVAEKHFLKKKLPPNKRFVVQDAGQFLKMTTEAYDMIIMDVFSQWDIPESAITTEFMRRMKSRVRPGGVIVMNTIASATFANRFARRLDNTIRSVFPTNLSRHFIGEFDGWAGGAASDVNALYIWHNLPDDEGVYTPDKNSTIYDR